MPVDNNVEISILGTDLATPAIEATTGSVDALADSVEAAVGPSNVLQEVWDTMKESLGELYNRLHDAAGGAEETASSMESAKEGADQLLETLLEFAGIGLTFEALKHAAEEMIDVFATTEKATLSLEILKGSSKAAEATINQLKTASLQLAVPFQDLVQQNARLTAAFVGNARATALIPGVLHSAADAAASTLSPFATSASMIERIGISGMVSARLLTRLGLQTKDVAEAIGVHTEEISKAFKKLTPEERLAAIEKALEKYHGASEKVASGVAGQMEQLKTQWEFALEEMGKALAPAALEIISFGKDLVSTLSVAGEGMKEFSNAVGLSSGVVVEALAAIAVAWKANPYLALAGVLLQAGVQLHAWADAVKTGSDYEEQAAKSADKFEKALEKEIPVTSKFHDQLVELRSAENQAVTTTLQYTQQLAALKHAYEAEAGTLPKVSSQTDLLAQARKHAQELLAGGGAEKAIRAQAAAEEAHALRQLKLQQQILEEGTILTVAEEKQRAAALEAIDRAERDAKIAAIKKELAAVSDSDKQAAVERIKLNAQLEKAEDDYQAALQKTRAKATKEIEKLGLEELKNQRETAAFEEEIVKEQQKRLNEVYVTGFKRTLKEYEKAFLDREAAEKLYESGSKAHAVRLLEQDRKLAEDRAALGLISGAKLEAITEAVDAKIEDVERKSLEKQLAALKTDDAKYLEERQKLLNQLQALEDKAAARRIADEQKVAQKIKVINDQVFGALSHNITNTTAEFLKGNIRWQQAWRQLGANIVSSWIDSMAQVVEQHLLSLLVMEADRLGFNKILVALGIEGAAEQKVVGTIENASQVLSDAAVAAAAAYASTAAIPIVGPELAPAAAAQAFGAVSAFAAGTTAAGGGILPGDMNVFAHKDEMILPANIAQHVEATAGGGAGGGSHTFYFSPTVHTMDAGGVARVMPGMYKQFEKMARAAVRGGALGRGF